MSTEQRGSQAVHDVHEVPRTHIVPAAARPAGHPRRPKRSRAAALILGVRRAAWALLALLLLAGGGLVAYSVLSGNWTIAPILSGSMSPGFPVGGVVVAERGPMSALAVGDVILFQNPTRPADRMVHRIIKLKVDPSGQTVVNTKGDANTADDPWTASLQGDSIYVAQFTLPLLGYAAVNTTPGINLMIGGVILLLVAVSTVVGSDRRDAAEKPGASLEASRPAGVTASAPPNGIPG